MSFVYAEKRKYKYEEDEWETIKVMCDTRISFNDVIGACISKEQLDPLKKYGAVKSTIVAPEFCISYAGNKNREAMWNCECPICHGIWQVRGSHLN